MDTANTFNNLCRICCELNENLIPLSIIAFEKLVKFTRITFEVNFEQSNSICVQCNEELSACLEFLDKCNRANEILSQFQQNKEKIKNSCDSHIKDQLYQNDNSCEDLSAIRYEIHKNVNENKYNIHTCHYCSKTFTRKFNLKLHLKRHNGEYTQTQRQVKLHTCPIHTCGKSFTSVTNLNTHIRTHNGERPYECNECGKRFRSSTTLNDHKRIHTGVKPYLCALCGKRFTTNKLSAHARTHAHPHARPAPPPAARPRPAHACRLCGASYAHRQSLNKHLRKRHVM